MALSAGLPIFRGYLGDIDCRWSVIADAVDDRRPEELGLEVRIALQSLIYSGFIAVIILGALQSVCPRYTSALYKCAITISTYTST